MKKLLTCMLPVVLLFGCGGDDNNNTPDAGPRIDADVPPPPPPPPPPPTEVNVSGQVTALGAYLAGNNNYIDGVSILALGVSPLQTTVSAGDGSFTVVAPTNGQTVFFANKAGYFPSYTAVTTVEANIPDQKLYITELDWLNDIAAEHGVDLNDTFACHGPPAGGLDPETDCVYAATVGRILDDGTAGNGVQRPVAGISPVDFTITGGDDGNNWYMKGPYFLNPDGTADAGNLTSVVENDNGNYRGGLYIAFVEVPASVGPEATTVQLNVSFNDQETGTTRVFGPQNVQVYRGYGVSWSNIYETGVAPPLPPGPIDFDSQIYPLFLPVNQGGYGCQGCHTEQQGNDPAGGMNLYGGPEAAYASLNPENYPARVNVDSPDDSSLLSKPLYEAVGAQNHPIFAFPSPQDPAYKLLRTWIEEGGIRGGELQPVSFINDIHPILYESSLNGGAGCITCHGNEGNPPGGFYMGGRPDELYAELTQEAPTDNGGTDEVFRISKNGVVEVSLVLTNPLSGQPEPHPTKLFPSNLDTRYVLLYRWIDEGYIYDGPDPNQ